MASALILQTFLEAALEDAALAKKRTLLDATKKKRKSGDQLSDSNGLRVSGTSQVDMAFQKIWTQNRGWAQFALNDAVSSMVYATVRPEKALNRIKGLYPFRRESPRLETQFSENVWPLLAERGWKVDTDAKEPGVLIFWNNSEQVSRPQFRTEFRRRRKSHDSQFSIDRSS